MASLISATVSAQYVDLYNDPYNPAIGWRLNDNWIVDTNGDPRPDVAAKGEGSPIIVWPGFGSRLSFTIGTQDTLHRVDIIPAGEEASLEIDPVFEDERPGVANYYYPHTAPDGATNVTSYSMVKYEGIYEYINCYLYSGSSGPKLAYEILPGGDPDAIVLRFQGQDSLEIDSVTEKVTAYINGAYLEFQKAVAYQYDGSTVYPLGWAPGWEEDVDGDKLFFVWDSYDPQLPLVFLIGMPPPPGAGPVADLDWSTTVGLGMGTTLGGGGNEFISAATSADDGDLLVAGNTTDDAFPANTGSTPHAGSHDFVFGRFEYAPGDPDNDARVWWMTYFGGTGNEKPTVIHRSSNNEIYVAGWTGSEDIIMFPPVDPADGTYWQSTLKGATDGLIIKVNPDDGALLRSTYFGGDEDEMVTAVTEDAANNIYLAGATTSSDGDYNDCNSVLTGFPMCDLGDYQQTTNGGGTDGFIMKLDENFNLKWSTLWGGAGNDLIYDAAFDNDAIGNLANQHVIFVGGTTGPIPTGPTGTYFIQGVLGDSTGFYIAFNPDGVIRRGSTIHGLRALHAVAVNDPLDQATVMGYTTEEPLVTLDCLPSAGELNICDPANGEFIDDEVELWDQYYADIHIPSSTMEWSTTYGNEANDAATFMELDEYMAWQNHPFPINRFGDLEMTGNGTVYGLGIMEQGLANNPHDFPTEYAWGFFNKDFDTNTGNDQTDVTLLGFDADRHLIWASVYGSRYDHIGGPNDNNSDLVYRFEGCDWGHDLVLLDNEALYWVGTTGGTDLDRACPGATLSWCEDQLPYAHGGDIYHGFVARMNLTGLSIGVDDEPVATVSGLVCFPTTSNDRVTFLHNGEVLQGHDLVVYDALGKVVRSEKLDAHGSLSVASLAQGSYSATVFDAKALYLGSVRFVKQQ
ncbi:MAG: T9SS type A sorting domain-containing protein [Flavobacteriales bacterium]|nr:MAG: T9SS type A sorting domain-containing protein [Flavobacteriales bacterium]